MPFGPMLRFGFPDRVTSLMSQISRVMAGRNEWVVKLAMGGRERR